MKLTLDELADMYRRYGLLLERRCTRILGSHAEGRDAAHEAFARAAEKLESFRGESDRLAWLYRISTHVCFNVLRERRTRGGDWQRQVSEAMDAPRPGTEDATAGREWTERLLALAEDETTRSLAVHVFLDEMSQGEAAELLGISRATANARLVRFRERARALLQEAA